MGSHVKGLLKGPKVGRSHTTIISAAIPLFAVAKEHPLVSKISLGVITPSRSSTTHLKFSETRGGLKMQVRGFDAIQIIWIYTKEPNQVIEFLTSKWEA